MDQVERAQKGGGGGAGGSGASGGQSGGKAEWSTDELALLIKAVNLFPAGTNQRWEVVASFVNQHHGGNRTAKEVLANAKDMQQSDFSRSSMKEAANKAAFNKFEKDQKGQKTEEAQPSERYETPAELLGINPSPWTSE